MVCFQVNGLPTQNALTGSEVNTGDEFCPDVALSNKIAAWNERRLLRDLYDIYYFLSTQNVTPDWDVLNARLSSVESRIPKLRKITKVSRSQLAESLESELKTLTQKKVDNELGGLIDIIELPGLNLKVKDTVGKFLITLRDK